MVRGQKKAPSYISEKQKHTQKDGKRETATLTLQMKQANAEFCHQHKFHLFSMSVYKSTEKHNYLYYQETGRVILYQRGGKVSLQKLLQISKSKFISKASVQVFKMVKNRYEM